MNFVVESLLLIFFREYPNDFCFIILWYSSPNTSWLAHRNNTQVNSILAKNVPILKDISSNESHWSYVGYKGGSEPGVLSMTYLLESKKGKRACLSMSWNNPKQNVSLNVFVDIIRKTLKLAEEKIP